MSGHLNLGIVGAAGWLGRAFAEAVIAADVVSEQDLTLSFRSRRPDMFQRARWTSDNQELFDRCDIVLVSVRPQDFRALTPTTRDKLVISVMAGMTLGQLSDRFPTDRVVRTLPNGAAEVRKSYTPWVASAAFRKSVSMGRLS